jgi:Sec-independent protein translocase protein TatA
MDSSLFNIGLPELIFILLLAGMVMGPQRIRQVALWLGRLTAQARSVSRAFIRQLDSELEAEEKGELKGAMNDIQSLQNELRELRRELQSAPKVVRGNTIGAAGTALNGAQRDASHLLDEDDDAPSIAPRLPKAVDVPDDPA